MSEVQKNADDQFKEYFSDVYFGLCQECKRAGVCGEAFCDFANRSFGYVEAYNQEKKRIARKRKERNGK